MTLFHVAFKLFETLRYLKKIQHSCQNHEKLTFQRYIVVGLFNYCLNWILKDRMYFTATYIKQFGLHY